MKTEKIFVLKEYDDRNPYGAEDIFTDKAYLPDIAEINEYGGN